MKLGETSNERQPPLVWQNNCLTYGKMPMFRYGFLLTSSLFCFMDYDAIFFCSYCGEENEIFVEPEAGNEQTMTEDCSVCCRPNVLTIRIDQQHIGIESEFEG